MASAPDIERGVVTTIRARHQIRTPTGDQVWVRAWPHRDIEHVAVRDDAVRRYDAFAAELGDDVAGVASVDHAATAHAQLAAIGAYYVALAAEEGLRSKTGKATAQLAAYFHQRAMQAAKEARAFAVDVRAQRAAELTTDGRELFETQAVPPEGPRGGSKLGPPNQPDPEPQTERDP